MDLALPPVSMQRRVQFAVLLQFAERGTAGRATTAAICPSTDRRDFEVALENLLDEGSIEGPAWRMDSLAALAQGGWLTLTARGQQRLDEDDV
jgi:hypothetical protein